MKTDKVAYQSNKLPKPFKKLAKKAGFIFWGDESWKPKDAQIDWAAIYDKELKLYTENVIKEIFKRLQEQAGVNDYQQEVLDCIEADYLSGFTKESSC